MKHTYPFVSADGVGGLRPYLPVIVVNPLANIRRRILALIDTGADECALPAIYAPLLGHELSAGQVKQVGTGNGNTTAYSHTVRIESQSFSTKEILIDFLPNLNTPLLGVKSFLSNLILEIDYPRKFFSLEIPDSDT